MIKRKGQIVPKYFFESIHKKSRHLFTFGCDVEIDGRSITAISKGKSVISISGNKYVDTNRRKRIPRYGAFSNVYIDCCHLTDCVFWIGGDDVTTLPVTSKHKRRMAMKRLNYKSNKR